jgi:hypothetical protein
MKQNTLAAKPPDMRALEGNYMKRIGLAILAAGLVAAAVPGFAVSTEPGQGQAVVTVMPKGDNLADVNITSQNLQVKVNGKQSSVTNWERLRGPENPLELVILMDSSARASIGTQLTEIESFVKEMPKNTKIAIAYMDNGRAVFTGPLSSDPEQVLNGLHLPGGAPGQNGSPYFCLSDLAKHWPAQDRTARREVVMITDGVDYYNLRYDPEDPYVQAAIEDSVRSGLVVYSIYWTNQGRIDRSGYENAAGQNLLLEVTQATGGNSYWEGTGNPVTFEPYFRDLRQRFVNQYRLSFSAGLKGKPEMQTMNLKVGGLSGKIYAPQQVFVNHAGTAGE